MATAVSSTVLAQPSSIFLQRHGHRYLVANLELSGGSWKSRPHSTSLYRPSAHPTLASPFTANPLRSPSPAPLKSRSHSKARASLGPELADYGALSGIGLILPLVASAASGISVADLAANPVLQLADLDPASAKSVAAVLGPFLSSLNFLFIIRIVMSWYPQLPKTKFPFVIAFAPTEFVLGPTRRLIPPIGGVDVAPVIWVAIMSFLNEILLGPQGLLVLLSEQRV